MKARPITLFNAALAAEVHFYFANLHPDARSSMHFRRVPMISGAHIILYSKNAEADRAFFRDVLGFNSVDAGHGWLIFALPPAEAAFHPSDESSVAHELYFMCDDLKAEMTSLAKKDVKCS